GRRVGPDRDCWNRPACHLEIAGAPYVYQALGPGLLRPCRRPRQLLVCATSLVLKFWWPAFCAQTGTRWEKASSEKQSEFTVLACGASWCHCGWLSQAELPSKHLPLDSRRAGRDDTPAFLGRSAKGQRNPRASP